MENKTSVFRLQTSAGRRFAQVALVAVLALVFLGAGGTATRFSALGHEMICACGCNQIMLECNHVGCAYSERMRGELQSMLDKGMDDEAILGAFVLKYGNTILAKPTYSGFNLVAWVVPFLVLGTATFFAAVVVKRWRAGADPMPAPARGAAAAELDEYRAQARRETEI